MVSCCVRGCHSRHNKKPEGVHFVGFPDDERRNRWIAEVRKVRGPDWEPTKYSVICSLHFKQHDFFQKPRKRCVLLPRAVPWVTPLPEAKSILRVRVANQALPSIVYRMKENDPAPQRTECVTDSRSENVMDPLSVVECSVGDSDSEQPQEMPVDNIEPELPVRGPRKALGDVTNTPRRVLEDKSKMGQSPAVSPAPQTLGSSLCGVSVLPTHNSVLAF